MRPSASSRRPPALTAWRWAAVGFALLVPFGCASAPRAATPAASSGRTLSALPAEALGTQRILKAQYDGPEGRAGFKLVLRLETGDRYDLAAVDGAGHTLWRLQARGPEGIFEDAAAERFCRLRTAASLPGGLGLELPLAALPRLLLGRLPVDAAPADASLGSLTDGARRWTWTAPGGVLSQWTLWQQGEPAVWWASKGAESTLSVRARATQVRWQSAVTEPIGKPLGELAPAAGYEEGACSGDLP